MAFVEGEILSSLPKHDKRREEQGYSQGNNIPMGHIAIMGDALKGSAPVRIELPQVTELYEEN